MNARLIGISVAIVGFVTSVDARAGDPRASALLEEGRQLLRQGRHEAACAKFEESHRVEIGVVARFHVAQCHERAGRIASAWSAYEETAAMARSRGQVSREKVARERAAALEPKLTRLVIKVEDGGIPGLTIKRNDVVIPRADWNAPLPIDPGVVVLEATAPDRQPWSTTIDASAPSASYEASVPPLEPSAPPVSDPAPSAPKDEAPRSSTLSRAMIVAAGAGVVALGASVFFTARAVTKDDESVPHCRQDICDRTGAELRSEAVTAGDLATVTAIGAGAFLGAAAILWVLVPSSTEAPGARHAGDRGRRVGVEIGVGRFGVSGSF